MCLVAVCVSKVEFTGSSGIHHIQSRLQAACWLMLWACLQKHFKAVDDEARLHFHRSCTQLHRGYTSVRGAAERKSSAPCSACDHQQHLHPDTHHTSECACSSHMRGSSFGLGLNMALECVCVWALIQCVCKITWLSPHQHNLSPFSTCCLTCHQKVRLAQRSY